MYKRWNTNWLMETYRTGEARWPSVTLHGKVTDDPMGSRTFYPRDPMFSEGRQGDGEPHVIGHGGGTPEMPDMIEVAWVVGGVTMHQPYDVEARS